jgi:hypothetical protein
MLDRPDPENHDLVCRKTLQARFHRSPRPDFLDKGADRHETYSTPMVLVERKRLRRGVLLVYPRDQP